MSRFISVDYEVFGRVQGVFFRKYTQDTARKYGLVGWVKNTEDGTVSGTIQGPEDRIKAMKSWLQSTGSPKSRIDRCEFTNEADLKELTFKDFIIDKPKKRNKMAKKK